MSTASGCSWRTAPSTTHDRRPWPDQPSSPVRAGGQSAASRRVARNGLDRGPGGRPRRSTPPGSWVQPVAGADVHVVRGFEPPERRWLPGHRGVDLAASAGSTVRAAVPASSLMPGAVAGRGVVVVSHGDLRTTYDASRPRPSRPALGSRRARPSAPWPASAATVSKGLPALGPPPRRHLPRPPRPAACSTGPAAPARVRRRPHERRRPASTRSLPGRGRPTVYSTSSVGAPRWPPPRRGSAEPSASGAWVGLLVRAPEPVDRDVRVDLGGRERRVPEQLLDTSQVRAAVEQVGGGRVSPSVRAQVRRSRYGPDPSVDDLASRARAEPPAPHTDEHGVARCWDGQIWPTVRQPVVDSGIGGCLEGTERSFRPLPSTRTTRRWRSRSPRSSPTRPLTGCRSRRAVRAGPGHAEPPGRRHRLPPRHRVEHGRRGVDAEDRRGGRGEPAGCPAGRPDRSRSCPAGAPTR